MSLAESTSPADRCTVLIPAAGPPPGWMDGARHASALVPVAGRPVIRWTVDYLRSIGLTRFVVAVREPGGFLEEFVRSLVPDAEFVVAGRGGLGDTVATLLDACSTESALVVLGDTYASFGGDVLPERAVPTVLTAPVDDSYRWCVADVAADGTVSALHDKELGLPAPCDALVGVYHFPQVEHLRSAVDTAEREKDGSLSLTAVLGQMLDEGLVAEPAGAWYDAGHADRRTASSRVLLAQRAFNSLEVDDAFGVITKRSTNVDKFIDEVNFLRLLPPRLAVLFPRLVDYSVDHRAPFASMEFYGYPTLAEQFLYQGLDTSVWRRIFEHLRTVLQEGFAADPRPVHADDVRAMYLGKLRDRLAPLAAEPRLARLLAEPVVRINGREVANLPSLWDRLDHEVERLAASAIGAVVHGDLCFSNVLYDVRTSVVKLIDPRGSFGRAGIHGDQRYDVAKLWHSVHGGYDLITADLFWVAADGTDVELELSLRPDLLEVRDAFAEVFFGPYDRQDVTLICGLMFCSLPALHYDHPDRQVAMYLRGLQLLEEGLGGR